MTAQVSRRVLTVPNLITSAASQQITFAVGSDALSGIAGHQLQRRAGTYVAGVCNEHRNVFGLMPHPEHAVDPLLGSTDGALLLGSLLDAVRERALAPV